ncbi:MAG: hypothetical protein HY726_13820 [Candidatus Rokubacteria bacterium]|nr:hypothetical protein [Candidatus Rokubacteria bacterium]
MAVSGLATADDLYDTIEQREAFEENRRPASLVDLAEAVSGQFTLRDADWGSLFAYIVKHWEVLPVLIEARVAIRRVFGEVRPILDLVTDPDEGWEKLFIVIPVRESVRMALERLRELDSTWFIGTARRAGFAINVTIERHV